MSKRETQNDLSIDYEIEKHVNLSTQLNRWMLKPIGIWPYSRDTSRRKRFCSWLVNAICYSIISFLFIPCTMFVFLELEDQYSKLKLFGPLVYFLMAFVKYFSLILHENDIRECAARIEWDWRNINSCDDKNIMTLNANFGRKLGIICTFFMYSGLMLYYIVIPMSMSKVTVESENLTYVPLVFPFSTLIADTRVSPTNEIVYFFQLLAGLLIDAITVAACSLAITLATHACGQMEVLANWLNHLVDGRADMSQTVDGRIADIVSYHDRILKFITLTEKTIQQLSFVEFLGCTVVICLIEYYIIMEWRSNDVTSALAYIILLISFTFNIFIFCYIGELVAEQYRKIGELSYMIEWYRIPGKRKLCCVLIIAMSHSSMKLTAGNMVELSINTFASVVKTSFAFLNVLRTNA